jgi:hypothetical protein
VKTLDFAEGLRLPLDAVTQTFAFLARKGAGKTYGASKLAEGMLEAEAQVVVIDPVGVWYGLRIGADGKAPGFNIPVFGGLHGDLPLEPTAGALVADLVVDQGSSLVLDVSMFRKGDRKRFVTDFAEQLYHRKKGARSPMHLFVEEAQVFVPQRVMGDEARMLGAFEDLVKLGRNFGIGITLISQRPQAVNKDALNQTECLVVLQTNGAQERKAIREWIVEQGLDVSELVDTLPSLERGEAWVWSPSWLRKTVRVRIGTKQTFNASATPELGKKGKAPATLEPIDLEHFREAMAATVQAAEANDPKALRAKLSQLERKLAEASRPSAPIDRLVPTPVLTEDAVKDLLRDMEELYLQVEPLARQLRDAQSQIREALQRLRPGAQARRPEAARPDTHRSVERAPRTVSAGDRSLPKGARDMLTALASTLLPSLSRNQVATLSSLKVSGGTFAKYLSILRTGELVEDAAGGQLQITEAGLEAIGGRPPAPASTDELVASWKEKLPGASRDMLDVLVRRYPRGLSREDLAQSVDPPLEPSGGTFAKYLSLLRTNGLVESNRGEVVASESLFLSGAA